MHARRMPDKIELKTYEMFQYEIMTTFADTRPLMRRKSKATARNEKRPPSGDLQSFPQSSKRGCSNSFIGFELKWIQHGLMVTYYYLYRHKLITS